MPLTEQLRDQGAHAPVSPAVLDPPPQTTNSATVTMTLQQNGTVTNIQPVADALPSGTTVEIVPETTAAVAGPAVVTTSVKEVPAELFGDAAVLPSTANAKDGTIDVVWYSGAMVPRIDRNTGEPYMLKLDMAGARLDRLNNGAPVFDTHFSGDDFKSLIAGKVGTRAQVGVVQRAWANGPKGMATLKFDLDDTDSAELFRKASTGIVQNLSFGTFIYKREKTDMQTEGMPEGKPPYLNGQEIGMFKATDWEPFEISPCPVPADFNTCFLNAEPNGEIAVFGAPDQGVIDAIRALSPQKEKPAMPETTQATGADARVVNDQALAAVREEAIKAERLRVSEITALGATVQPYGIDGPTIVSKFIADGISVDDARKQLFAAMEQHGKKDVQGGVFTPNPNTGGTLGNGKDALVKRLECMQAAITLRADSRFFLARHPLSGGYLAGCGEQQQRDAEEKGREYRNFKLMDMAKEYLQLRGVDTRGWDSNRIAETAMRAPSRSVEYFEGGAESTSDFPAILANVANKTLRQGYEAYPRTFQPFCRQMTAADFKPINRVMLADAPSLQQLNEKGEYHRAQLTDNNVSYQLATYGEIVAITRKVIINDDLQAFTRVPALLGVAAARLESDTVWGLIINNPQAIYAGDTGQTALFAAAHNNLLTGAGTNINPQTNPGTTQAPGPLAALANGRQNMRLQKGPQGTPLNLIPRFIAVPTALETYALQFIFPINLASATPGSVVPEWVRGLVPVVEPRLDAASEIAWYLIADPAQIDTIEYCYLEGQQGVYIETKQGFEIDGVEIKARMDFGAAAIDYRGLQKSAGA